jgi:UDP-N-acetylmuramate--alanine ligase
MFLGLRPTVAVITNVDHDHPDIYPTLAAYQAAFADFVRLLPQNGRLFLCADDSGALALADAVNGRLAPVTTYGLGASAALRAVEVRPNPSGGHDFLVLHGADTLGVARLRVPGLHNVRNALAAIGVALTAGLDFLTIQTTLAAFGGVGRRFEEVDTVGGVTVIDDYAHHPTEIRATLAAARQRFGGRRLWAVWQPHTFSRTLALLDEFKQCFDEADRVLILDVYRSREQAQPGLDLEQVAQTMAHPYVRHIGRIPDAASYILDRLYLDDVIITLSAGDGNAVGQLVLDVLKERLNR